jgi:hypothetical protein
MRKLTIDETWDYTKRMWKWIAFQKFCGDERSVEKLKEVWLEENKPEFVGQLWENCFFCAEKRVRHGFGDCHEQCPASLVEKGFGCCTATYNFKSKPGAFYREILRLDAIRTAVPVVVVPPEHVWKHGDVYDAGHSIGMYIESSNHGDIIVNLEHPNRCGTPAVQLKGSKFLFNIKDALSDRGLA